MHQYTGLTCMGAAGFLGCLVVERNGHMLRGLQVAATLRNDTKNGTYHSRACGMCFMKYL